MPPLKLLSKLSAVKKITKKKFKKEKLKKKKKFKKEKLKKKKKMSPSLSLLSPKVFSCFFSFRHKLITFKNGRKYIFSRKYYF